MPIDQEEMNRLNRMTERSWHPRPIDALGVLFRAEFRGEEILPGYDFAVGWSDLFAGGLGDRPNRRRPFLDGEWPHHDIGTADQ
jgi:hypothetical protein